MNKFKFFAALLLIFFSCTALTMEADSIYCGKIKYKFKSHYLYMSENISDTTLAGLENLLTYFPCAWDDDWPKRFAALQTKKCNKNLLYLAANAFENNGCTVIGTACYFGDVKLVKKLIRLGAKLDTIDDSKMTKLPLHWAIINRRSTSDTESLKGAAIVKYLLDKGARTDIECYENSSPLKYAQSRNYKGASFFLEEHIKGSRDALATGALYVLLNRKLLKDISAVIISFLPNEALILIVDKRTLRAAQKNLKAYQKKRGMVKEKLERPIWKFKKGPERFTLTSIGSIKIFLRDLVEENPEADINEALILRNYENNILHLVNINLKKLPESIGALRTLKELRLAENKLEYLPDNVSQLTNVETIILKKNNLSSLPENFGNLTSLEYLSLRKNKLKILPGSFTRLSRLQILYLNDNDGLTLPWNFGHLTNLAEITVGRALYNQVMGQSTVHKWGFLENKELAKFLKFFQHEEKQKKFLLCNFYYKGLGFPKEVIQFITQHFIFVYEICIELANES